MILIHKKLIHLHNRSPTQSIFNNKDKLIQLGGGKITINILKETDYLLRRINQIQQVYNFYIGPEVLNITVPKLIIDLYHKNDFYDKINVPCDKCSNRVYCDGCCSQCNECDKSTCNTANKLTIDGKKIFKTYHDAFLEVGKDTSIQRSHEDIMKHTLLIHYKALIPIINYIWDTYIINIPGYNKQVFYNFTDDTISLLQDIVASHIAEQKFNKNASESWEPVKVTNVTQLPYLSSSIEYMTISDIVLILYNLVVKTALYKEYDQIELDKCIEIINLINMIERIRTLHLYPIVRIITDFAIDNLEPKQQELDNPLSQDLDKITMSSAQPLEPAPQLMTRTSPIPVQQFMKRGGAPDSEESKHTSLKVVTNKTAYIYDNRFYYFIFKKIYIF